MSYPLLSLEWIEHYKELWNKNESAIEGTRNLSALVELAVSDSPDGRPPVQFNIGEGGIADYAGPVQPGKKPTFRLTAPSETWRQVGHREMGVKRAVAGPIRFQGSLVTAMRNFAGLEAALLQFGDVPTTEWGE